MKMESTLLDELLLSLFKAAATVHVACTDGVCARLTAEQIGPSLAVREKSVGLVEGGAPTEGEAAAFLYDAASSALRPAERKVAYGCHVTYGSAAALAFDRLRDMLPGSTLVQGEHDTLILLGAERLLDEAQTPLVIAAPMGVVAEPDEAAREAAAAFEKGRDYIVQPSAEGTAAIVLLDKAGHPLPGRRWCNRIHEAIEAREGLPITPTAQPLVQTTLAEYAALYRRRITLLSGATTPEVETAVRERFAVGEILTAS
jgi:preprotein translocase subunit SecA